MIGAISGGGGGGDADCGAPERPEKAMKRDGGVEWRWKPVWKWWDVHPDSGGYIRADGCLWLYNHHKRLALTVVIDGGETTIHDGEKELMGPEHVWHHYWRFSPDWDQGRPLLSSKDVSFLWNKKMTLLKHHGPEVYTISGDGHYSVDRKGGYKLYGVFKSTEALSTVNLWSMKSMNTD